MYHGASWCVGCPPKYTPVTLRLNTSCSVFFSQPCEHARREKKAVFSSVCLSYAG